MREDIFATVTNQIIAQLEQDTRPWVKPWHGDHSAGRIETPLRWNGQPYFGANILILWLTAEAKGYTAPLWLTYNQTRELGGNVKAGEKSSHVIYCNKIKSKDDDKEFFMTRTYCVFNADQTEGLPAHYYATTGTPLDPIARNQAVDAFIANTKAEIIYSGTSAHYSPSTDRITLPPFQALKDAEGFYTTSLHELAHWSGAKHRINRELKGSREKEHYGFEELIAEISSVFTAVSLGVIPSPQEENASYLKHWLQILKADSKAIFRAAAAAQRATDYLHAFQPQPEA